MEIKFTEDVKQDVANRLIYKAKQAKTEYFVSQAMGDDRMMKYYQEEYDKAMNWLISHNLA